jgi:pyrrolidone-carboxylate peptidase
MNAEEFLKTKGIGKPTIKAVRLPHKYKNIELELIPLMEEYAELKLLGIGVVVGQNEQFYCIDESYHKIDRCKQQCDDCKRRVESMQ